MILNHQQIKRAVSSRAIIIEPMDQECVEAASYDLRMGSQAITTTSKEIIDVEKKGLFIINPGEFAVIIAYEKLELDKCHTGRFGLKSKYSRMGLIATIGPQIDPGYRGKLIVGLTNLSPNPIIITFKEKLLTVEFHRLEEETESPYDGPFQDKDRLTGEEARNIIEGSCMIISEMSTTLRSLVMTVDKLSKDIKSLTRLIVASFAATTFMMTILAVLIFFK